MKLAPKLVSTVIVSVCLAMAGVGFVVVSSVNNNLLSDIDNRLAGDANFSVTRLEEKQAQISAVTHIFSQSRGIAKALTLYESRGISQLLNDPIKIYPYINYILVTEADGSIFATSTRDNQGRKLFGEQLLMEQIADNPRYVQREIGRVSIGNPGDDPYLPIIGLGHVNSQWFEAPILKRGKVIGWIIVSVDWEKINLEVINRVVEELADTGNPIETVLVMDKAGRVLIHDTKNVSQHSFHSLGEASFSQKTHILSTRTIKFGSENYELIVVYDRERATQVIEEISQIVMVSVVIGSALLGAILFFIIRATLLTRLTILHQAVQKIGQRDDVSIQLSNLGSDEIADLGKAMIQMELNLRRKTTSIDALNEEIVRREGAERSMEKAKVAAENAANAKSEFLAGMSHEIRTPMNGVLGMLGLLENSELTERQSHQLRLALVSARSLLTIINDILDFSKIEAGKLALEIIDFNVCDLVGDFAEIQEVKAAEKGLLLVVDTSGVNEPMVRGDPGRLRQILTNLVGNSLKFTEKGEVVIRVSLQKGQAEERLLIVSITDTGIGIAENKQKFLFDAFTQADVSTTRKFGGTGLGLSICKQLCELMGGSISVQSTEGKGACFEFNVVLYASQLSAPVPQIRPAQRGERSSVVMIGSKTDVRLLVVDDNPVNQEVAKGMLAHAGYTADIAVNGLEAISLLTIMSKDEPYDLILMDCQMPVIDGYEASRRIRKGAAGEKNRSIPIIAMTANAMKGDKELCLAAGMNDYISKPLDQQQLTKMLVQWLPGKVGAA